MSALPGRPVLWPTHLGLHCTGLARGPQRGGLWLGGGLVGTYNATASRIRGAFTAAPMKPQTPSLSPLYGWSTLSAYVVRTSTLPSPEDGGFHPAGSLEAGEGSSGAPQRPEGVAQGLPSGCHVAGTTCSWLSESRHPHGPWLTSMSPFSSLQGLPF